MTERATSRRFAASLALVVSATGLAAIPSTSAVAGTTTTSITVVLRAPHPARLSALARAADLSHRQRIARLRHLVPSARDVAAVTAALSRDGLVVRHQTAWTLSASGPSTAVAAAHLLAAGPSVAALPHQVAEVLPTYSATPAFHSAAAVPLDGTDFRDAYATPRQKPVALSGKPRPTIATLQLAGFTTSDLATYAKKTGLPNIVGTSQYRPINVDGGSGSAASSGGGDVEVALDQESILSTSPGVNQRPYFAPNTGAGFIDVFSSVFDDVTQDKHAKRGGDPNIVALSTSWGGCEGNEGASQIHSLQTVIKSLVAAGVTVFASSGDDGIYDCRDATGTGLGDTQAGVDYPASSPQVVGVGGTNLQAKGKKAKPNNGHNWRETSWTCHNPASCEGNGLLPILPSGTGGTGGGESGVSGGLFSGSFGGFAEPAYQKHAIKHGIFAHQKKRMVPDISADGDPATGFKLYVSDSSVASDRDSRGLVQVGGTSLSSPMSAALFTSALAAAGRHTGVGDIHHALYTAYRKARHRVFRDVTSGQNGAPANRGHDPSVFAHKGYDTLSGLGGVLWPRLVPFLRMGHHKN